jgi:hypothetical protein
MADPEKKFVRRGLCFGQRRDKATAVRRNATTPRAAAVLEKKNVSQKRELHLKKKIPKKQLRGNASTLASQKTEPQAGQWHKPQTRLSFIVKRSSYNPWRSPKKEN